MVALNNEYRKEENKSSHDSDPLKTIADILARDRKEILELETKKVIDLSEFEVTDGGYLKKISRGWLTKLAKTVEDYPVFLERKPPPLIRGFIRRSTFSAIGIPIDHERLTIIAQKLQLKETLNILKEIKNSDTQTVDPQVLVVEPYHREVAEIALRNWEEIIAILRKAYDPYLLDMYLGFGAPIPIAKYAPHAILITETGVGKTTLGNIFGDVYERASTASVIGGAFEGRIRPGVVNGKDYLQQIEQFEVTTKEDLPHLQSLLANGYARRLVFGTEVETRFTGSMVFTANIDILSPQREIGNLTILILNANALGSRFIPIVLPDLDRPRNEINEDLMREAIHGARWLARKKVYRIYVAREVREWLENPDITGWEKIREATNTVEWDVKSAEAYIRSFEDYGVRRVRGLALAYAIMVNLHTLDHMEVKQILEAADERLEKLVDIIAKGIRALGGEVTKDLERILWEIARGKRDQIFTRLFLETLHEMIPTGEINIWLRSVYEVNLDLVIRRLQDEWYRQRGTKKHEKYIRGKIKQLIESPVGKLMVLQITENTLIFSPKALHEILTKVRELERA